MSNINCGIGVLHVKRQIFTYFCVTSFIVSFDWGMQRDIENFLWLSLCDMIIPSKSNVPSL